MDYVKKKYATPTAPKLNKISITKDIGDIVMVDAVYIGKEMVDIESKLDKICSRINLQ